MFSIDQNSHSLWDALPKLHALQSKGVAVRHVLEDIDVAFTALGAKVDEPNLHIARESFHHSGGSDWGAALFYNKFLGRLPVELRQWEPILGMKISAVARQLELTLDELYRRYAVSDNFMLIGSSYVGDEEHHRTIGDLEVRQVAPFVRKIVGHAEDDCLEQFPAEESRRRTREWFAAEKHRVERLLERHADGALPDLYRDWMGEHLESGASMELASRVFALGESPDRDALLEMFLRDYKTMAKLYNQAVRETSVGVHPLDTDAGEAPFFAFGLWNDRQTRCEVRIRKGQLILAGRKFPAPSGRAPLEALRAAGVTGLAGKAVVLALQARLSPAGAPLALPHWGSLYMPACHRFAALLREHKMLPGAAAPVMRVRFGMLDRLRSLETPIRLPKHLSVAFGRDEIPARMLGESWRDLVDESKRRLADFTDPVKRKEWQKTHLARRLEALKELNRKKRSLAGEKPKDPRIRGMWKRIKAMQNLVLTQTIDRVARDWQVAQLEYYDSRGALLPWCVALGGEELYRDVVASAEIREETE
ncbi:MAG: hypothetical protein JXA11_04085 [Phycisphaerae bacterium]|nr:hypothetical protein [Phycisphaerae bacterium]